MTELTEPRTDCPETLPPAPKTLSPEHAHHEAVQPLNDLQEDIVSAFEALRKLHGLEETRALPTMQGHGSEWISDIAQGVLKLNKEVGQRVFLFLRLFGNDSVHPAFK